MKFHKLLNKILLIATLIYASICAILYFFQEGFIFHPEKLPENHKFSFKNNFTERVFEPEKDIKINALHFKSKNNKTVVFYLHGNAGNLDNWGNVANDFISRNCDVLMIDYRGFGKSTGSPKEETLNKDAVFIYKELAKEYGEQNIIVYGRSIGTSVASYITAYNDPKLLILETPFYSMKSLTKKYFRFLPNFILKYEMPNYKYIERVLCPIIIFHGKKDQVISYKESVKISNHFKQGDELIFIENGNHNNLPTFDKYKQKLNSILTLSK